MKFTTLEKIAGDLEKFVTAFTKKTYDHQDFHHKVRESFADLYDMDEADLTISDGVRIQKDSENYVKWEILRRIKLLYGINRQIVHAFEKVYTSKPTQLHYKRR